MKFDENISVILTAYNCREYLSESIQSILNQTYTKFELIVIDDGSTDNTESIIKSFTDVRINYFRVEHSGKGKALNYGLQNAKYDWVAIMDSDDIAHPERFARQLNCKNLVFNDVVFPDAVYFKGNKIKFFSTISGNSDAVKKIIRLHGHICPGVIFNKDFILAMGGFDENLDNSEDYDLWMRIFDRVNFVYVNIPLMFVRIRKNSLSRDNYKKTKDTIYFIKQKYNISYSGTADGWNEFFYGSRYKARIIFKKHLINPKVAVAYLVTLLPERIYDYIIDNKIVPGVKFFIYKLIFFRRVLKLQKILLGLLSNSSSDGMLNL